MIYTIASTKLGIIGDPYVPADGINVAALWRSRGSIETAYAAFDTMGTPTQQSLTPIVKQLLGIPRPAVA